MIEIQDEHDTELLALFNYFCNKKIYRILFR